MRSGDHDKSNPIWNLPGSASDSPRPHGVTFVPQANDFAQVRLAGRRSIFKPTWKGHKKGVLMSKIDTLVQDFLAQKRIAVVGVSDKRETGCNLAYRKFKEAGYAVSAVNPRLTNFEGDPCYPDL